MNANRRHLLRALPAALALPTVAGLGVPARAAVPGVARLDVQASDALAGFYDTLVPAFERWWVAQGRGPVVVRTGFGAPGDGEPLPLATRMVLLVRRGNPRRVRGWDDLARADVATVVADPARSDEGRWAHEAIGQWAEAQGLGPDGARAFARQVTAGAVAAGRDARDARHAFALRGIGDVLVTAQAEARALVGPDDRGSLAVVEPAGTPWVSPRVAVHAQADDPAARAAEAFRGFHRAPAARALALAHGWRAQA